MSGTSDGAEKGWEARRANIAIRNEQLRAEIERLTALANSYSAQISSEQAENERLRARQKHAIYWLRQNCAEIEPSARRAFIDAHNAVLAIIEGRL